MRKILCPVCDEDFDTFDFLEGMTSMTDTCPYCMSVVDVTVRPPVQEETTYKPSGIECECGVQMDWDGDKLICFFCGHSEYPDDETLVAIAAQQSVHLTLGDSAAN